MKFFIFPTFTKTSRYYSFYSSILLLCSSIYLYFMNQSLSFLLGIVGLLSIFHHSRSYEQEFNDLFRYLDIFFANLLGLYVFYLFPTIYSVFLLSLIGFLFLSLQKIESPIYKSFFHSIIHILVCFIIFFHLFYKN